MPFPPEVLFVFEDVPSFSDDLIIEEDVRSSTIARLTRKDTKRRGASNTRLMRDSEGPLFVGDSDGDAAGAEAKEKVR